MLEHPQTLADFEACTPGFRSRDSHRASEQMAQHLLWSTPGAASVVLDGADVESVEIAANLVTPKAIRGRCPYSHRIPPADSSPPIDTAC